ncbi:hypothetical protein SO802_008991 [Lithocarpus litseifolius]|uniref:Uncharacterized protein n=1 Tax=Lithocarpus litseifolius TaxID=425828 RepID=A0AAW2DBJ2_9ROSI
MEEELILATKIILSVFLGGLVVLLLHLYDSLLVKPKKLRSMLQEQGINGHSPSFLSGNIPDMKRIKLKEQAAPKENHNNVVPIAHDWPSTNFPYFDQWRKEYEFETIEAIKLSVLYDLLEWGVGSSAKVGSQIDRIAKA